LAGLRLRPRLIGTQAPHPAWRDALGAEDVWLRATDGTKTHGWWARSRDARLAALFLHGLPANIGHRAPHIREILAAGSDVLIIDCRGYGRSLGTSGTSVVMAKMPANVADRWRTFRNPHLLEFLELRDSHLPIWKDGSDLELPPQRLNVSCQRAEVDVGSVFDLRHLALVHPKRLRQLNLRHPARLPDLL
jgi:hypothetical protein